MIEARPGPEVRKEGLDVPSSYHVQGMPPVVVEGVRVDLRVNWKPGGDTGRWLFYLDIINLLNRQNVGAYEASLEHAPASDRPRLVEKPAQRIPFLPSFGIRFRF